MGPDQMSTVYSLKVLAGFVAVVTLIGGGWLAVLQLRFRQIDNLFRWKDTFLAQYNSDKVELVREYATKDDVNDGFEKLEKHIDSLGNKIDKFMERGN